MRILRSFFIIKHGPPDTPGTSTTNRHPDLLLYRHLYPDPNHYSPLLGEDREREVLRGGVDVVPDRERGVERASQRVVCEFVLIHIGSQIFEVLLTAGGVGPL